MNVSYAEGRILHPQRYEETDGMNICLSHMFNTQRFQFNFINFVVVWCAVEWADDVNESKKLTRLGFSASDFSKLIRETVKTETDALDHYSSREQ